MQIVKWQPFKELDRLFTGPVFSYFPSTFADMDLAADIYEENGAIVTKMSLPGVDEKNLDISITEDTLIVSGYREEEKETDKKDYYSKEIRRGSFSRIVTLPKKVNTEKAYADYKEGVLSVVAPISEEANKRAVKVPLS